MAVTGIPTNNGIEVLSTSLRENVKKFVLYGTSSSSSTVPFDETSTYSSLSEYQVFELDVARAYFDDNGTLTFECPIPYSLENTSKWISACGLVYVDSENGNKTLVAISSMPRFQKTQGIGGTILFKTPIAGTEGTIVFEELPYVTRQEIDVVLNELYSGVIITQEQAGIANREIQKTLSIRNQTGEMLIKNRGVVRGCEISKSSDATRNLNCSSGSIFIRGQIIAIPELMNTAYVSSNPSTEEKFCYVYLWIDENGNIQADCTELGQDVPDYGLLLYKIVVPANSTEATDPYLANCTLIDQRRLEPNYPTYVTTSPAEYVPLTYNMLDDDYIVNLEILDFDGSGFNFGYVYIGGKAANGFSIYFNGTADNVKVRWHAIKNNL